MTDYVKMPIVDLDDVGEYINSPKQKKLMNRLYHLEEFNKMLTEIIDNYIEQVVHMTDDELVIDRSNFIKNYSIAHNKEDKTDRDIHIQTLCIEIEQLRRFGYIYYEEPRPRTDETDTNRITEKE
tara:strand:+ start:614 stop:988 length:375 start_codon:yes stop_codon:yes gene_type:complete